MSLSDAMIGVAHGISLHTDVAGEVPALPGRMFKKIKRELVKGKARQRAEKKAVARRMRRFISSHLLTQAEVAPADAMEGVKESPIQAAAPQSELEQPEEFKLPEVKLALLNASRVKKHKGRKAKNSSFSRPPPFNAPSSVQPLPAPPPPPQTPVVVAAPELERKIARLEAALLRRDRSKQQRSDAFNSLKSSEHKKMLQLMDANEHINRLEAKLERVEAEVEEARKETVTWIHRAEKFKVERYQEYAHLIDPIPPPPHAIEWGTLVRQPEFWGGVVGLVTLLAAVYATSRYMSDKAPAYQMPISCPRQVPCPRPPRVESQKAQLCPMVECSRVECPRVLDCPTESGLPVAGKCRGTRHLIASYAVGALMGGVSTWQTFQAMD